MEKQQTIISEIPSVLLSQTGKFKYILIEGHEEDKINSKRLFVRGSDQLQYHADNYDAFADSLRKQGYAISSYADAGRVFKAKKDNKTYKFSCLGGGRIIRNYKGNGCFIYGYSKSFGRVDHKIAQEMVAKALGLKLQEIQTSQEGY